ncbi:facilitated trehalose transporter Tret1 [Drosophila grimshawi]|uniref:facilitated trehalose transporter Tret1 n=1 Tax=Drosophila grimshawi TaxID=7222 RepID=UPI000C8705EA|nr:facilitated trehalose transporter Tret1 [Drosophila grimshawi]
MDELRTGPGRCGWQCIYGSDVTLAGNAFMGLMLPRIGSRLCLLFIAIPQSFSWLLIYLAENDEDFSYVRFLAGISGGCMYIAHPIFISEISDAKIRGTLATMVMLSLNIGILFGCILGRYLDYQTIPLAVIVFPLSYFILTLFLIRNSPVRLIRKRKFKAAEKSFRYYKNINKNNQSGEMLEFTQMQHTFTADKHPDERLDKLRMKDFLTRAAFKAYGSAAVLIIVNQFSGLLAMVNHMSNIFQLSGSSMDPATYTIILGVIQILGTFATTLLCDKWGRRILLMVSSAGVVFSLTVLGLFEYYLHWFKISELSWVPLFFMSLYVFLSNIGLVGCFFVVLIEMFPPKITARASSISIFICNAFVFLILTYFPYCMNGWQISTTMWSCVGVNAFGFVYFVFFLKETKGKSMQED